MVLRTLAWFSDTFAPIPLPLGAVYKTFANHQTLYIHANNAMFYICMHINKQRNFPRSCNKIGGTSGRRLPSAACAAGLRSAACAHGRDSASDTSIILIPRLACITRWVPGMILYMVALDCPNVNRTTPGKLNWLIVLI